MNRVKLIAKTIFLVVVRAIEIVARTYVYLIHPLIFTIVALLLAVPGSEETSYEERFNKWCDKLILCVIDWYDDKQEWLNNKLDNLLK